MNQQQQPNALQDNHEANQAINHILHTHGVQEGRSTYKILPVRYLNQPGVVKIRVNTELARNTIQHICNDIGNYYENLHPGAKISCNLRMDAPGVGHRFGERLEGHEDFAGWSHGRFGNCGEQVHLYLVSLIVPSTSRQRATRGLKCI